MFKYLDILIGISLSICICSLICVVFFLTVENHRIVFRGSIWGTLKPLQSGLLFCSSEICTTVSIIAVSDQLCTLLHMLGPVVDSQIPPFGPVFGNRQCVHRPRRYALLPSGPALYPLTPPKTDSGRSSLCLNRALQLIHSPQHIISGHIKQVTYSHNARQARFPLPHLPLCNHRP